MTIAMNIKEIMSNMPDTLNTKTEVESYYKAAMKKAIEINKKDNDAKPKKELNEYQKFMKDNISIVKEKNSQLTGPQVFSLIATMWKEHKAVVADVADDKAVVADDKADVADDKAEVADLADDKAVVAPVEDDKAVVADVAVAKKKKGK